MARIGIKEFHRKITERIKSRFKKKYNWPELDTFCCCSLFTGIYIKTLINLVVTGLTIMCTSNILINIMGIDPIVFTANSTTNANKVELNVSNVQEDLAKLHIIYNSILVYFISYLSYKTVYVLILLWTIFAIFKKSGKLLKILLWVSVPNLILDILICFLAALTVRLSIRIVLIFCILFEVYNIVALSSQYKNIMGKSKVRHKDIESESGTPSIPSLINAPGRDLQYDHNQVHCSGCNCTINGPPDNGNGLASILPSSNSIQTNLIADKKIDENVLNYAITGILNPRNTDESVRNETAGSVSDQHTVRPNTLDLTANMVKDEKIMITDEPVIYDVNQLNVGTSPVIEDREREA